MELKKNIPVGKNNLLFVFLIFFLLFSSAKSKADTVLEMKEKFVEIKILDKISSKNNKLKIEINKEVKFKNLLIKVLKCQNSEFDDNPEITAYIQVKDLVNKNKDDVFVFNGWIFSSSPSITPFDHPVYDIWLVGCN